MNYSNGTTTQKATYHVLSVDFTGDGLRCKTAGRFSNLDRNRHIFITVVSTIREAEAPPIGDAP